MANWSELQYDVLVHVAKRLNLIEDYLNFAAVCKPWRRAATKNNFNSDLPRVPWLMLAEEENNKEEGGEANTCRKFFSLYNGMILKKRIPNARGKRCMESMGWLIAAGKDEGEITLLHPFSGVQIQLPHPNTTKGYNCQLTVDPWTFFHKAVLSASPSKTSDYVLMVIEANNKYLSFWRPGDLRWTRIMKEDNPALHRDVVYFNGKFYAVQWLGHVLVCDVTGAEPMAQKVARLPLDQIGDELVYKLDIAAGKLTETKELGDRAIFFGANASLSVQASQFPGIKPNCIYFTDDRYDTYGYYVEGGGLDMGVYNLADDTIQPHYKGVSLSPLTPPTWVTPTLC
ncbi:PREDICTED: F-box/kelch-repeat protein At1g57790-like [Nicotiana attenuata]|uniref:F-box/kelch-repeat protein At1g57790-like n=1 Tax=Nicotiana attenuata TaxID=49451 RepID=UPI000905A67E|nr:PREDICTED: F-box/kelch-repeat protein At1g57790-like [Nicotiana attenuata]